MGAVGRVADRWAWCAVAWAVLVSVAWLVVPAGRSTSTTLGSDGTVVTETAQHTLLASEGAGVLVPLAVPVLIAAAGVVAPRSRRIRGVRLALGGVLLAACVVAGFSIGLPYLPAAVALLVAGATLPVAV